MSAVDRLPFAPAHPPVPAHDRRRWLVGASLLALAGVAVGLYFALIYAPADAMQGDIQRIFYIHVPAFMGAALGFLLTVIGGIAYIRTRNPRWDRLALAGVEVGVVLSIIVLATGSIWARPIWNTWWTWDPRLTSSAIMVLTYAAYLMLRQGIEVPDRQRLFASVYGILAFTTVVFTTIVIRIRPDTMHPAVIGASPQNAQGGFNMTAAMGTAFGFNLLVWVLLLTPVLIWWRVRLQTRREAIDLRKAELIAEM